MIVDTFTIMTSTSQLTVTSAHYTAIAKALDCKEYLVTILLVRLGFFTLSMRAFGKNVSCEKFDDDAFVRVNSLIKRLFCRLLFTQYKNTWLVRICLCKLVAIRLHR